LIDDTEHPFYPVVQFIPFIGMKTDNLKLPYGLRAVSGKTLTWASLRMAAIKHLEMHGDAEGNANSIEFVRDFAHVAASFVSIPSKRVYLNTNLVYHNINLDDDVRKNNLKEDMFILATLDADEKVIVKDELRDFLNKPIIKECSNENRGYFYEGLVVYDEIENNRIKYFEFKWGS